MLQDLKLAWFSSYPLRREQIISERNRDGNGEKLRLISVLWIVKQEHMGCPQRA